MPFQALRFAFFSRPFLLFLLVSYYPLTQSDLMHLRPCSLLSCLASLESCHTSAERLRYIQSE